MIMRSLFFAALCGFCLAPSSVRAAPFCVEAQGFPAECWYYDARTCRDEAVKRNGHCSANIEDVTLPEQGAPFCLVGTGLVPVCAYHSVDDCDAEAAKQNAVCSERFINETLDDPYRFDRPSFEY